MRVTSIFAVALLFFATGALAALRSPVYPMAMHIEQIIGQGGAPNTVRGFVGPVASARRERAGGAAAVGAGMGVDRMTTALQDPPGLGPVLLDGTETAAQIQRRAEVHFEDVRDGLAQRIAQLMCSDGTAAGRAGYGVSQAFYSFEQRVVANYASGARNQVLVWNMTLTTTCPTPGSATITPRITARKPLLKSPVNDVLYTAYIPSALASGLPAEWAYDGGGKLYYKLLDQAGNPLTAEMAIDVSGAFDEPGDPLDGSAISVAHHAGLVCMFDSSLPDCTVAPLDVRRLMDQFGVNLAIQDYARRLQPVYVDGFPDADGSPTMVPLGAIRLTRRTLTTSNCQEADYTNEGEFGFTLKRTVERWIMRRTPGETLDRDQVVRRLTFAGAADAPELARTKAYTLNKRLLVNQLSGIEHNVLSPFPNAAGAIGELRAWADFQSAAPGFQTWPLPPIEQTSVASTRVYGEQLFGVAGSTFVYPMTRLYAGIGVSCDLTNGTLKVIAGFTSSPTGDNDGWHPGATVVRFAELPGAGTGTYATGFGRAGSASCAGTVSFDGISRLYFKRPNTNHSLIYPGWGVPYGGCDSEEGVLVSFVQWEALSRLMTPDCGVGRWNPEVSSCTESTPLVPLYDGSPGCPPAAHPVHDRVTSAMIGCEYRYQAQGGWYDFRAPPPIRALRGVWQQLYPLTATPQIGGF